MITADVCSESTLSMFTRNKDAELSHAPVWAEENPRIVLELKHQQQFRIPVWAGIIADRLIGSFILPGRFTIQFLTGQLNVLLKGVAPDLIHRMWFIHKGTLPNFCAAGRTSLSQRFPNKCMSHGGSKSWPANYSDLNPLDFYVALCMQDLLKSVQFVPSV